jgi:hypothetical protein
MSCTPKPNFKTASLGKQRAPSLTTQPGSRHIHFCRTRADETLREIARSNDQQQPWYFTALARVPLVAGRKLTAQLRRGEVRWPY